MQIWSVASSQKTPFPHVLAAFLRQILRHAACPSSAVPSGDKGETLMFRRIALVTLGMLMFASRAVAQDQWGVSFAVTPSWQTGPGINRLFGADRVDMKGSEVRWGFVRGTDVEGDWGMSLVKTTIASDSSLDVDVSTCARGNCGTFLRTNDTTRMTGFEVHKFEPFKTWRDRIQLGMLGAVGLGWMQGQIYKRTTTENSDVESFNTKAGELFPPSTSIVPLLRMEVATAVVIVPGLKLRASGGFAMPGYHTFGFSFLYLIPSR
jgi:hypothetical protein